MLLSCLILMLWAFEESFLVVALPRVLCNPGKNVEENVLLVERPVTRDYEARVKLELIEKIVANCIEKMPRQT